MDGAELESSILVERLHHSTGVRRSRAKALLIRGSSGVCV